MININYSQKAKDDYDEAKNYYAKESEIIKFKFIDEVKNAIELIKVYPNISQIPKNDILRYVLKTFPYSIYYTYNENEKCIYIYAIASNYMKIKFK